MRQVGMRKKILMGVLFAGLVTLGAATAAFTAGAAPFGAQATSTIVSTVTTGGSTVVTTITTTTPDSTSSSTGSSTGSTSTTTTTTTTTTSPRKMTICHHAGKKGGAVKHVTITISRNAWSAHQRHGDSPGRCTSAAAKKFHSKAAHVKRFHGKKKK